MQDFIPRVLADFLGGEEFIPAVGGDGFVGFDAAEAGVFVAQVAEAGDQDPFQGVLAGLEVGGGFRIGGGFGPALQAGSQVQDRFEGAGTNPSRSRQRT